MPGSRYIDWLIPGMVGDGHHEQRHVGGRLLDRPGADAQAAEADGRQPDAEAASTCWRSCWRGCCSWRRRWRCRSGSACWRSACRSTAALGAIAVVAIVGALAFGALGLLLGSRARTFEAVSGLMNLAMLPMWLLSGVFFSSSNFPDVGAAGDPGAAADGAGRRAARGRARGRARCAASRPSCCGSRLWTVVPFAVALRIFKWR